MIQTVVKRDGRIVGFNEEKIITAIRKTQGRQWNHTLLRIYIHIIKQRCILEWSRKFQNDWVLFTIFFVFVIVISIQGSAQGCSSIGILNTPEIHLVLVWYELGFQCRQLLCTHG